MQSETKSIMLVLAILLLINVSNELFACSCIGKRSTKQEIKNADALIVGTIVERQLILLHDSTYIKAFPSDTSANKSLFAQTIACYKLTVQDIYKGHITRDTISIYTGIGGGDCGVNFTIGEKYIVYGQNTTYFGEIYNDIKYPKGENTFWTNLCLLTGPYNALDVGEIERIIKRKRHNYQR